MFTYLLITLREDQARGSPRASFKIYYTTRERCNHATNARDYCHRETKRTSTGTSKRGVSFASIAAATEGSGNETRNPLKGSVARTFEERIHFSWLLHHEPQRKIMSRLILACIDNNGERQRRIEQTSSLIQSSVCFALPRDLSSIVWPSTLNPPWNRYLWFSLD